ncbi:uncharacterized protein TNCT_497841 [Trichonephila clavata]|uniref:Uncharacterized protein n=1 Tax=Trichonephila clavata TaxID=2740835 RepID=A0A8X6G359_TRICU|nr:uncharacterized protein TNCT_497841 [Trichonephila clavata]
MGTDRHENHTLSLGFSRAGGGAPDTAAATVLLREQRPYLLVTRFQGHELLRRKVNSSPGPPTASPSSFALPHLGHGCPYLRVRRQFCLPKVAHAPLCILTREASESGEAPFSSVRSLRRGRVTRASPRRSNHSLYPARLLRRATAILRETSEGTSYQVVRLVFRPYTRVGRSICTSEPLRTSSRVSSAFVLPENSSPPIGSLPSCSRSVPTSRHGRSLRPPRVRGGIAIYAFAAPLGFVVYL